MHHQEIVIDFDPCGRARTLHMDAFPLTFLGRRTITRASTIDHNPGSDRFDIRLADATEFQVARTVDWEYRVYEADAGADDAYREYPAFALGFEGYDEARAFEVNWIQESKKQCVDPLSDEGIAIGTQLRSSDATPRS